MALHVVRMLLMWMFSDSWCVVDAGCVVQTQSYLEAVKCVMEPIMEAFQPVYPPKVWEGMRYDGQTL